MQTESTFRLHSFHSLSCAKISASISSVSSSELLIPRLDARDWMLEVSRRASVF
jgi:hypothetical protein